MVYVMALWKGLETVKLDMPPLCVLGPSQISMEMGSSRGICVYVDIKSMCFLSCEIFLSWNIQIPFSNF